jgi:hypothetical protein
MTHFAPSLPKIISVDDHAVEPPALWQDRLPRRWREQGPRVMRTRLGTTAISGGAMRYTFGDDGDVGDVWCFEDVRIPMFRAAVGVGFTRDEQTWVPITYDDMRPGCYDPVARLSEMDINGVEASMWFPDMFMRFCGQTFSQAHDRDLGLACIAAYNDWMVEDWAGSSGAVSSHCASCRCGTPSWPPPRCAATQPAASARSASARCRRSSACRQSILGTGTRCSPRAAIPAR